MTQKVLIYEVFRYLHILYCVYIFLLWEQVGSVWVSGWVVLCFNLCLLLVVLSVSEVMLELRGRQCIGPLLMIL